MLHVRELQTFVYYLIDNGMLYYDHLSLDWRLWFINSIIYGPTTVKSGFLFACWSQSGELKKFTFTITTNLILPFKNFKFFKLDIVTFKVIHYGTTFNENLHTKKHDKKYLSYIFSFCLPPVVRRHACLSPVVKRHACLSPVVRRHACLFVHLLHWYLIVWWS